MKKTNKTHTPQALVVLGGFELRRHDPDGDMLLGLSINRDNLIDTLDMLDQCNMAFSPAVLSKILRDIRHYGEAEIV